MLENQDPLTRDRILAKRRVALLFYESSTRTRTSFELAAKGLGADTALISSLSSSIEKGESLKDTGLTLRRWARRPLFSATIPPARPGCWKRRRACRSSTRATACTHPTQALLDLRTILGHLRPGIARVEKHTGGHDGDHRRRYCAQPGGAIKHAAAAATGGAGAAVRAQGTLPSLLRAQEQESHPSDKDPSPETPVSRSSATSKPPCASRRW